MLPFKFLEGFLYVYCESLFGNFNKIVSVLSWSHCVLGSYSGHEQLGALESPEIRGKILCSCGYEYTHRFSYVSLGGGSMPFTHLSKGLWHPYQPPPPKKRLKTLTCLFPLYKEPKIDEMEIRIVLKNWLESLPQWFKYTLKQIHR